MITAVECKIHKIDAPNCEHGHLYFYWGPELGIPEGYPCICDKTSYDPEQSKRNKLLNERQSLEKRIAEIATELKSQ